MALQTEIHSTVTSNFLKQMIMLKSFNSLLHKNKKKTKYDSLIALKHTIKHMTYISSVSYCGRDCIILTINVKELESYCKPQSHPSRTACVVFYTIKCNIYNSYDIFFSPIGQEYPFSQVS